MAAASSGGEADELIGEMARSEVNEMGDEVATASGGGEARRKKTKRSKKSGAARRAGRHEQEDGPDEGSGVAVTSIGVAPPRLFDYYRWGRAAASAARQGAAISPPPHLRRGK